MKKVAVWGSLILALMACSRFDEQEIFETRELVFTATREESDTKTVRVGTDVLWSPGDAISIFFRSGDNGGSKFTAQNTTENVAIAQFKGTIDVLSGGGESEDGEFWFWGIYPYSSQNSCDGSSITTVIPTQQTGKAGTFADNTFITMARSKGLNLAFYNICSGVKFTLTRDDIKEVKIRGNNSENIAGKVKVVWDSEGHPAIDEYVMGTKEVTVTAPGGGTFETGQDYYIVLAPELFSEGFTMTLVTSDSKQGFFVYENSRQFKRGIFINISDLDTRVASWVNMVSKSISQDGGEVTLEFFSDLLCHAEIPVDAQSWISVAQKTKAKEKKQTIGLIVQPNTGLSRYATINVVDNASNIVLSYSVTQESNHEAELAYEREALVAFYNALDGDNWTHNENWCSDKPVTEWYGINYGSFNGQYKYNSEHVVSIYLYDNNLSGQIPESFYDLLYLKEISLPYNNITGHFSSRMSSLQELKRIDLRNNQIVGDVSFMGSLPNLKALLLWHNPVNSFPRELCDLEGLEDLSISPLRGTIPTEIGQLKQLRSLYILGQGSQLDGSIPEEVGELTNLIILDIAGVGCKGTIPNTIGNLINLVELSLNGNNLEGTLPPELGNLHKLSILDLSGNKLCGGIPPEYGSFPISSVVLLDNCLSGVLPPELSSWMDNLVENQGWGFWLWSNNWFGPIPDSWQKHPKWKYLWHHIMASGEFDSKDVYIPGPDIIGKDINGEVIDSEQLYGKNNYTILFEFDPYNKDGLPLNFVDSIYNEYSDLGVDLVMYGDLTEEVAASIKNSHPGFLVLPSTEENSINGFSRLLRYPATLWDWQSPAYNKVTIVDSNGLVIYSTVFDNLKIVSPVCTSINKTIEQLEKEITTFFQNARGENPNNLYFSTDYSQDGRVEQIQSSKIGEGANIVFMGDGFSDRQIADGTYGAVMQNAMNAFFSEAPYNSLRDYFNVYFVDVVSLNEGCEDVDNTALSTALGTGTTVVGNNARVLSYGLKAIQEDEMEDCIFVVLMNKDAYAGTCYMYSPPSGNYGRGLSIAYFPVSSDTDTFNGLVSHEAGGHGFAKLADEYAYEYMGAISDDAIADTKVNEPYGWWKNVDFTSDPVLVKWSQFLADDRYANEGLGCYEGGLTYWSGVWRPTDASIMRYNTGGFNAPSRYAIWYRIGKLAYGENWEGSYEDFVTYDAVNRTPAAIQRRNAQRRNYVEKPLPQLPAPVVVGHSWREELEKGR